jgi:hypothetical protein
VTRGLRPVMRVVLMGLLTAVRATKLHRNRLSPAQLMIAVWVCLLLCLCGGCYDSDALVNDARSAALKNRAAEIDLGTYHTTLPRDPDTNSFTELLIHIFGTVPRYQVSSIEKQLQADAYELRHRTLAAVRSTTRAELAEPDLEQLRSRIEKVVNDVLADASVGSIGFYEIRMRYD